MIRRLVGLLRRKAVSRGFGVHSPFAYSFITEALVCPPGCCYPAAQAFASLSANERRLGELTVRVHSFYGPGDVSVVGFSSSFQLIASTLFSSGSKPMLLVTANSDPADVTDTVGRGGTVILAGQAYGMADDIRRRMKGGMSFDNGRTAVIAGRTDLPRQDWIVEF